MSVVIGLFSACLILGILWIFGYLVVDLFARGYFQPRAKELAVSLLVGTLLPGLVVFPILRFAEGTVWFERALTWSVPILLIPLAGIWRLRRSRDADRRQSAERATRRSLRIKHMAPYGSVVVLLLAAVVLIAIRPGKSPAAALELSAIRDQGQVAVTINDTGSEQADYIVVVSEPDGASTTYQLDGLGGASGQQTFLIQSDHSMIISLFTTSQNPTVDPPLRWLRVPGRDGSLS